MEHKIDVTVPFVAIRKDAKGNEFALTMGEYVCNPLAVDLFDVSVEIGGFYSDDSGVIETVPKPPKPTFVVPAYRAVRYTISTLDEYYEFMCSWTVRYRAGEGGGLVTVQFGMSKFLGETQEVDDIPILGGAGNIVPQSIY